MPAVVWMSMSVGDVGALARLCTHAGGLLGAGRVGQCSAHDRRRRRTPTPRRRPPRRARAAGLPVEVVDAAPVHQRRSSPSGPGPGAGEGLVVVAEHQTAGRGRLDRTWETPARAALTFSVLLRPGSPPADWPWLPLLTGYAVARALREAGVPTPALKWPNDVLVDDRKVAGILVERVETPTGPAAVVGIGLNVAPTAEELPVATRHLAGARARRGAGPHRAAARGAGRPARASTTRGGPAAATPCARRTPRACVTVGRDGAGRAARGRAR